MFRFDEVFGQYSGSKNIADFCYAFLKISL